jgi:predicted DNA-binding ribbon-helix-helix protein
MGKKVSVSLEDALVKKLRAAAKARNCSVSKFAASMISEKLYGEDEAAKKRLLRELRGAIKDERGNCKTFHLSDFRNEKDWPMESSAKPYP